ncbi:hypothetical protein CSUB01_12356 [Colletotrichum sublineola]|uniref:Uncharacterized protein n=1 Tax=Colletotrichum sublineola TaxID=1173701 RepID=A0A066XEY8_COLSU|nr:hypothetical protein CSUB01_12356 [Colletotrichum sublineola]
MLEVQSLSNLVAISGNTVLGPAVWVELCVDHLVFQGTLETKGNYNALGNSNSVLSSWFYTFCPEANAGSTEPSTQAAHWYGQDEEKFLVILLFLVHLSYGQPARAPELLTVRHQNTADGGVRNIMMDRGLVMIVTGIHKGYSRSEREKFIHRFLPREIGSLLVYNLWVVLPFWESAQANAGATPDTFLVTMWGLRESANPFGDGAGRGGAEENDREASDAEANTGQVRPAGAAGENAGQRRQ